MRIAVASTDGKMVNQHFGKAEQFFILDFKDGKVELVEVRKNLPPCGTSEYDGHEINTLASAATLIADCAAVLCSRIGIGAQQELISRGIEPIEIRDFIESAVQKYMDYRRRKGLKDG